MAVRRRPYSGTALAPEIRGAFRRAILLHEQKTGKSFSELILEEINQHGLLAVMKVMQAFDIKEISADITETKQIVIDTTQISDDMMRKAFDQLNSAKIVDMKEVKEAKAEAKAIRDMTHPKKEKAIK